MENKNLVEVRTKTSSKSKIAIWALAIVVAVLVVVNGFLISLAYFSNSAQGSSIITFGSVEVEAYALNGSEKTNTITLDASNLMAGVTTTKDIQIDVIGKNNCYIRLSGQFQIALDGSNYVANDLITFSIDTTTNTNWKLCDGKYYYTSPLNGTSATGGASTITVPLNMTVSEDFGNSSLNNSSQYNNKPYKIIISIESCQAEGTSLGSGANFDYTQWVA